MHASTATMLACIVTFASACVGADIDDGTAGQETDAISSTPRPTPTAPKPPGGVPVEYTWSDTGAVYDFDSFSGYGVNLVDPLALFVRVPYAYVGDRIRIDVAGSPYAEHLEHDVVCDLRAHVADGLRPETPFDTGGSISFALSMDPETRLHAAGIHTVIADGITYVRILGRVSRPDRFCGLTGSITLRVTQER